MGGFSGSRGTIRGRRGGIGPACIGFGGECGIIPPTSARPPSPATASKSSSSTTVSESPAEKAEVTERLRKLLGEHFDRDQVVKEYRVKHLARQLAELKARLAERRKGRAALIEKRLTDLLKPPPASRPATSRPATTRPAPRRYLRHRPPLTPEREAALMQFVRENAPELLAQLERLRKDNPPEARKMLSRVHRLWRRVRAYPPTVRAAVLARRRLNVAIERAVQKIRSAENRTERERLIPALRKLLGEEFGHSQVFLEYRLARLGRELEDLRVELAARRLNRSSIIAERLGRLLLPPRPPARVTSRDESARTFRGPTAPP